MDSARKDSLELGAYVHLWADGYDPLPTLTAELRRALRAKGLVLSSDETGLKVAPLCRRVASWEPGETPPAAPDPASNVIPFRPRSGLSRPGARSSR